MSGSLRGMADYGLVWRRELLAAGFAPHEVRRQVRTGELVPVRRGAYVDGGRRDRGEQLHAVLIRAALPAVADGAVVSHASAAVLFGIPLWDVPLDRVHVTRCRRSGARRGRGVHVHAAPLDPDELTSVDGVLVTSPARTVVDLARSLPFEHAVVIADGALARRLVTHAELQVALERAARRPGLPAARRAVAFADEGGTTPGESRSRVALHRAGLPRPVLQWDAHSRAGLWLARVDFAWPDRSVLGEFDGKVKYGRLLMPGEEPGDVVFAEKLREDALRDEGFRMGRWTWPDLDDFTPVATRLWKVLA